MIRSPAIAGLTSLLLALFVWHDAGQGDDAAAKKEEGSRLYDKPQKVTIRGYDADAMEPFITRDGKLLLFNNRNDPAINTNLHYARRVDDLTFEYAGEMEGVNTPALEGVATADKEGVFYFVSPRNYDKDFSTIYRGKLTEGRVSDVELVPGISKQQLGLVNFDVDVSADGNTLYFVDSHFGKGGIVPGDFGPLTADLVIADRRGDTFERAADSAAILEHVNSEALEFAACISADSLTLFFNRLGKEIPGLAAIYVATRTSAKEPFGKPLRLTAIEGFAEGATLSPDEKSLYYHTKKGDRFVLHMLSKQ